MTDQAITTIAVSRNSIRVVLSATRIVYQGRWNCLPVWFDIGRREAAFRHEFEVLARWYSFKQVGLNDVQIFVNGKG